MIQDTDFDAYWKELKPAECDEVKEYFVECWQRAQAVQREKDAEICQAKADDVRKDGIDSQALGFMHLDYSECAIAIREQEI